MAKKRGQESKVENQFDFLACRWHVAYYWKALNEGYNFDSNFISIRGFHAKLWAPKVAGVLTLTILGLPLGNLGTKCHLDVGFVERRRVYYKGEGGGFPQVRAMVSLVSPSCLWLILTPKVFQLCTNHFVLVLCKLVWVSEACQFFLVPSRSSSTPLYPSKVLWAMEHALTPYFSTILCSRLAFESLKELGARHFMSSKSWLPKTSYHIRPHKQLGMPLRTWRFIICGFLGT